MPPGFLFAGLGRDGCREDDEIGTMLAAKDGGDAEMLLARNEKFRGFIVLESLGQAQMQAQAAQGRPVEWPFSQKLAADHVRAPFRTERIEINVFYTPDPRMPD